MSFDDDDVSAEDSAPRDYFEIVIGMSIYRIAHGARDVWIGTTRYESDAINTDDLAVVQLADSGDPVLKLKLRANHPIVQRWFQYAIPPKTTRVTAYSHQLRSGASRQFWVGPIVSIACEDAGIATLTVSSIIGEPMRRRLPTLTAGRQCGNVLYDDGCRVSRTGVNADGIPYRCVATVAYVDGRDVRLDLSTVPANYAHRAEWLTLGELVHVASGERMTIGAQKDVSLGFSTVTVVTLQAPIAGMQIGDAIEVYAGCAHDIDTCFAKFGNNQVNFGGFPQQPTRNPFFAASYGVVEQR